MKIAVVTGCPSGVAHTVMASQALKSAGKELGYEVFVEEQGRNPIRLKPEQIAEADVVIISASIIISDKERFNGKKILDVSIKNALMHPKETLLRAVELVENS